MIGEIGGPQEAEGAAFVHQQMTKPVIAYIAGLSAPRVARWATPGRSCPGSANRAQEKVEILGAAGAYIAPDPSQLGTTVAAVLGRVGSAAP